MRVVMILMTRMMTHDAPRAREVPHAERDAEAMQPEDVADRDAVRARIHHVRHAAPPRAATTRASRHTLGRRVALSQPDATARHRRCVVPGAPRHRARVATRVASRHTIGRRSSLS